MPSTVSLISNLSEAHRSARSGSKAASLARLIAARFAVPKGFVISADAYRSHLWASGSREAASATAEAEEREAVRSAILSCDIPEDVWVAIASAYERLSWQTGVPEPVVAVRSSALEENGLRSAFPSAYESHLNVCGAENLKLAIKRVWASLWNGRAAGFRAAAGCHVEPAMAVIVQEMVTGPSSGSASSADQFTGNPNVVRVVVSSEAGVANHEVSLAASLQQADPLVARVAESAILVEDLIGKPVEIEWLHDGERLCLLQATPIESLPPYFAADETVDSSSTWTRWTQQPVCTFSRSHLWSEGRVAEFTFPIEQSTGDSRVVNGRVYRQRAFLDDPASSRDDLRLQKHDIAAGARLLPVWRDQVLPAMRRRAGSLIAMDLAALDHKALLGLLREAADISRSASDLFEATWYPSARFPGLLKALVGGTAEARSTYLRLAIGSAASTHLDAVIQELGDRLAAAEKTGRLEDPTWWRDYKREVDLLARQQGFAYASRDQIADISSWQSWIEDMDALFRVVGALSRRGHDPTLVTRHCARERDAATVLADCSGLKPAAAKLIRDVAALAQNWRATRSEAAQVCALANSALRLVMNELAPRLVKLGILSSADCIYHLTLDELLSLPSNPTPSDRKSVATKIASRKHSLWLERRLAAPETLPLNDELPNDPDQIAVTLKGECMSPGVITARARVCRTVTEAGDLQQGEVLVVPSPMPAWTAFLGLAGGFIAEEADEIGIEPLVLDYGIPAIVSCSNATTRIATGQRITLDATNSVVNLPSTR